MFRTSGELHIAFSTGHVQTVYLRGEVSAISTAIPTLLGRGASGLRLFFVLAQKGVEEKGGL